MPAGKIVESESLYREDPMARPYVLKPVNEGSSVGVAIVTNESNYGNPIGRDVEGPWKHFDSLLAEPFVKGHELTVAVLNDEALAVTELKPKVGFYDYDCEVYGRPDRACLPGAGARRYRPVDDGHGGEGAPAARLPRSVAFRLPLGRRTGRSRHFSFGSQHSTRNDPLEPCARAGEGAWHQLRGTGRAADRRSARQKKG